MKVISPVVCLSFLLTATAVQAQFLYSTNNESNLTLIGYTGPTGNVSITIPASDNGMPVTSIGSNAFQYLILSSVTIPNSVTNIGDSAFYGCDLLGATIGHGVLSIGNNAFAYCSIGQLAIPNSVTNIGDGAFYANNLFGDGVTLGNGVRSIGNNAFFGCSFTNLTIPTNVTSIGNAAFGDANIFSVTIPASVTNLGGNPFCECSGLSSIGVNTNNPVFTSVGGVLFDKNQTTLFGYPAHNTAAAYSIPNTVTSIAANAFDGTRSLTNITIPNSVTSIGSNAFANLFSLTNVTIPASVINLEEGVFVKSFGLTNINVDSNNPAYASVNGVLFNKSLTSILEMPNGYPARTYAIPFGVTNIAAEAFYFDNLFSVTIPNTVISIENSAFESSFLQKLIIPASVVSIGGYALDSFFLASVYFEGNPPVVSPKVFTQAPANSHTITYYLPGTTGWSNSFAGAAAFLWNPTI